jgi:hypothetical protein
MPPLYQSQPHPWDTAGQEPEISWPYPHPLGWDFDIMLSLHLLSLSSISTLWSMARFEGPSFAERTVLNGMRSMENAKIVHFTVQGRRAGRPLFTLLVI